MEKKYDHLSQEKTLQAFWHDQAVYRLGDLSKKPLISIDTPPPTVSGSLHIGHIFSYTHTDIIARDLRMSGNAVFYPFGFDDNGLPTERYVEKKQGVSAFSIGRSAFIQRCLQETALVEHQFQLLWQAMGLSIDWKNCYSTISDQTRTISQRSFIQLYHKKFVYRTHKPALYCTTCYTSVAQAELDDAEKPGVMYTLTFMVQDGQPVSIGTTRPEFLGSCVAVLYNPEDVRYQHLAGKKVYVPLYDTLVPFIAEETVKIDKGTGLVMCCAFGDSLDVEWIKKHNLAYETILQRDGKFGASVCHIAGLKVKPAREKIVAELTAQNIITDKKEFMHSVNVHERCKNEIEYLSLSQWFVELLKHKQTFLELANQITWYPSYMKARYDGWVENLNADWCISRQRFFGIPFPCWHCTNCSMVIMAEESQLPIDPQETPYGKPCPQCGSSAIVPDTDVMDTWNTSSLSPYICKDLFEKSYPDAKLDFIPMSIRPQAHDIIRTWAFDTIVKVWMHDGTIPWKSIVISGHVLSNEKQKISKSQGNSPLEPENLLKTYPADVIRYWTAGAQLGTDTAFSENQLKIGQRLLVKLWNAFLFIKEHGTSQRVEPQALINRWMLHELALAQAAYQDAFSKQEFNKALDATEKLFWHVFCDNYLEIIKDQFFNPDAYSEGAETRAVLYQVGYTLLQLYAPFIPFITEAIYQELYKAREAEPSLHTTRYEPITHVLFSPEDTRTTELLLGVVTAVRKLKSDANVSLKTELAELTLAGERIELLQPHEQVVRGIARAQAVVYSSDPSGPNTLELTDTHYKARVIVA